MVLQKRLDYGFNGYQVPPTPRATRSARRRSSLKKRIDDTQMCAFDLLATVAGKLLLDGENSHASADSLTEKGQCVVSKDFANKEQQGKEKSLEEKPSDERSCDRPFIVSELISKAPVVNNNVKELSHAHNDACSGLASVITTSDCSEKVGSAVKLVNGESRIGHGKIDVDFSGYGVSAGCKLEDGNKNQPKIEPPKTGKVSFGAMADICRLEDPVVGNRKRPALVSSDNSVKFPFCRDRSPRGSFPKSRNDVNIVVRDDDENSSGCTQPSTVCKAFRPPRIEDRRMRRLLASKYWKVTPKLKDRERFSTDADLRPAYRSRRNFYHRQRSLRDYPFKKRKIYDHSSVSNSGGGFSSDGMSSSPGKVSSGDVSAGTSAFAAGQHTSFQPRDSHVKLKIKSFRVPELFIEIPETATVGSLKRRVMDAVTAILSGGLHVGVLLQGKKIRDDTKTLQQTGIFHDNKLDALGFMLEPNRTESPPPQHPEGRSLLLPCETPQPLARYPAAPSVAHKVVPQGTCDASLVTNFGNLIESDHDSAPSPPDTSIEKSLTGSRALVAVSPMTAEALAAVPVRKVKRSDAAQRRIRRPFSVSEVEALVQAVEKLGTGRWRDVKMRAFDNAKHRTYVDLKDKWKTLVHTARISPQQRRGEPVPQELLDRVLCAHAYWSQQQAKQQCKQQPETCFLL
ncbi:hypothetical protein RJ640_022169 [Escallonia rubra]|uniref:Telomere repeat-binding protein 5 n=1 Tax=Escallonia rubra TaxID=112253 RepID=A0AA88RUK6_9ASTE|nr:hypothetical protein RJ640_022169 [Escallonia rubra]